MILVIDRNSLCSLSSADPLFFPDISYIRILLLQNDFSFEKRDWMSVNPEELPNGSQLVRGKNLGIK